MLMKLDGIIYRIIDFYIELHLLQAFMKLALKKYNPEIQLFLKLFKILLSCLVFDSFS